MLTRPEVAEVKSKAEANSHEAEANSQEAGANSHSQILHFDPIFSQKIEILWVDFRRNFKNFWLKAGFDMELY